jgi:hypothetical protein
VDGLIPETLFKKIENAIKREKLIKPLHWVRTFVGGIDGEYTFEALLDNEIWASGEIALKKVAWKKNDGFYSIRNFFILKQIGPNKLSAMIRYRKFEVWDSMQFRAECSLFQLSSVPLVLMSLFPG